MPSFKFASATGSGSSLIVTCSDQFAGKTITCTNGTKTYTRTCPSTSPYEVVFKGIEPGTWTVSGVVKGTTYSQQVVITDFDVTLTAGFDYKRWVTLGGLDPTDYASLSEVFADEVAVRRLMTIHASADYLIEKVTDDIDTIDDFTANDTAMKWIGLRDYVCDGLTAIAGVEAKFLASEYWERYLKDHVPVMTSNTAPYGTAFADSLLNSNYAIYYPFTGDRSKKWYSAQNKNAHWLGYKFVNPICVKRFTVGIDWSFGSFVIQGSNDGTTYTDISQSYTPSTGNTITDTLDNDTYYKYLRIYVPANNSGIYFGINLLQFYGRSLNETVSTAPTDGRPYATVSGTIYSVSWTEREFAEGSTMKYLYDHGVELENIEINDNTTKEDDYISIKATTTTYYGMIVPTNSIDLTDYSIERVKIGDVMSGGIQIQASTQKTSYDSGRIGYKTFNVAASDLPNNLYYDVSAVNQSAYPNIVTSQVNYTIDISEWWLE